jgi:hypothetical protein
MRRRKRGKEGGRIKESGIKRRTRQDGGKEE